MAVRTLSPIDKVLAFVLAPLENPTGLLRPAWFDASAWQQLVNCEVLRLQGFYGGAFRSAISWGYQDAWFKSNYERARQAGMYRTNYFVPYPDQPLARQVDNWYDIAPEIDVIPRVIDLELDRAPARMIAEFTWNLVQTIIARDGIAPIIYSRKYLIDTWLAPYWTEDMMNTVWWWLAQYLADRVREHPGPPALPNKVHVDRVVLHQTSDKKPAPTGATVSGTIDWDRWEIGNPNEMHVWIQQNWGGELPVPPPSDDLVVYNERRRVNATALNVRALPTADSADLGELINGTVVPVIDEKDGFVRIDGWVSKSWTDRI